MTVVAKVNDRCGQRPTDPSAAEWSTAAVIAVCPEILGVAGYSICPRCLNFWMTGPEWRRRPGGWPA